MVYALNAQPVINARQQLTHLSFVTLHLESSSLLQDQLLARIVMQDTHALMQLLRPLARVVTILFKVLEFARNAQLAQNAQPRLLYPLHALAQALSSTLRQVQSLASNALQENHALQLLRHQLHVLQATMPS